MPTSRAMIDLYGKIICFVDGRSAGMSLTWFVIIIVALVAAAAVLVGPLAALIVLGIIAFIIASLAYGFLWIIKTAWEDNE